MKPKLVMCNDYPDYAVTEKGEVWFLFPLRKKKLELCGGYLKVSLRHKESEYVHRLVAKAFLGHCPAGHNVNHKNGIKTDNRIENLEYVTFSENLKHAVSLGLIKTGENSPRAKLTEKEVKKIRAGGFGDLTQSQIARKLGITQSLVSAIVCHKCWTHLSN